MNHVPAGGQRRVYHAAQDQLDASVTQEPWQSCEASPRNRMAPWQWGVVSLDLSDVDLHPEQFRR